MLLEIERDNQQGNGHIEARNLTCKLVVLPPHKLSESSEPFFTLVAQEGLHH